MTMYTYTANQFNIYSDFVLPCDYVPHGDSAWANSDVHVRYSGRALDDFYEATYLGRRHAGTLRSYDTGVGVLLCIMGCLRLHVSKDGNKIEVDAAAPYHSLAGAVIINLGLAVCSLFRSALPLHAAGIGIRGRFIGIMASSGSGKSTLAWELLKNGAKFGNDDVIPMLCVDKDAIAFPSRGLHLKLSREILEKRNIDLTQFKLVDRESDEVWVPVPPSKRILDPRPLDLHLGTCPT